MFRPLSALRSDCPSSRQVVLAGRVYQSVLKSSRRESCVFDAPNSAINGCCILTKALVATADALKIARVQECARFDLHQMSKNAADLFRCEHLGIFSTLHRPTAAQPLAQKRTYLVKGFRGDAYNAFILPAILLPPNAAPKLERMLLWRSEVMYAMHLNHSPRFSPPPDHIRLRWRAAGVPGEICVANIRVYSTCTRNMSPLRAFGLFQAGSSISDSKLSEAICAMHITLPGHFRCFSAVLPLNGSMETFPMPSHRTEALRTIQTNPPHDSAPLSCYIAAARRGSASLPSDEQFHICARDLFAVSRRVLRYHRAFCADSACLGTQRQSCARARRGADRERGFRGVVRTGVGALGWREARAGVSECAVSNWHSDFEYRGGYTYAARPLRIRARWYCAICASRRCGFDTEERARTGRIAACEDVRCARDVPRTRAVGPAAVLTRSCILASFFAAVHTVWFKLEAVYSGAGVTSSVARDVLVPYARK
ncbi:hypothetical protein FB451DRAFT_1184517 [Mycena latifolia]|nr:hypothetical protein FB451DRAFT_1184517 [Mycena latifolia]